VHEKTRVFGSSWKPLTHKVRGITFVQQSKDHQTTDDFARPCFKFGRKERIRRTENEAHQGTKHRLAPPHRPIAGAPTGSYSQEARKQLEREHHQSSRRPPQQRNRSFLSGRSRCYSNMRSGEKNSFELHSFILSSQWYGRLWEECNQFQSAVTSPFHFYEGWVSGMNFPPALPWEIQGKDGNYFPNSDLVVFRISAKCRPKRRGVENGGQLHTRKRKKRQVQDFFRKLLSVAKSGFLAYEVKF